MLVENFRQKQNRDSLPEETSPDPDVCGRYFLVPAAYGLPPSAFEMSVIAF